MADDPDSYQQSFSVIKYYEMLNIPRTQLNAQFKEYSQRPNLILPGYKATMMSKVHGA